MTEVIALWHHRHDVPRSELAQAYRTFVHPDAESGQLEFGLAFFCRSPTLDLDGSQHQVRKTIR